MHSCNIYSVFLIGLTETHLLIYENEREIQPHGVLSIYGCTSKTSHLNIREEKKKDWPFEVDHPSGKSILVIIANLQVDLF